MELCFRSTPKQLFPTWETVLQCFMCNVIEVLDVAAQGIDFWSG